MAENNNWPGFGFGKISGGGQRLEERLKAKFVSLQFTVMPIFMIFIVLKENIILKETILREYTLFKGFN